MKLRVLNEFGSPLNLQGCDGIKVRLPYENGEVLEKSNAEILDYEKGHFKIELSDFEIQGLKSGTGQSFFGELRFGSDIYKVEFRKGLNVVQKDNRKALEL